jgi:hypothetical protein
MSEEPPAEERAESPSSPRYNPLSDEALAEMTQLQEAARVAPWVEIARANLEAKRERNRRFGRRKS